MPAGKFSFPFARRCGILVVPNRKEARFFMEVGRSIPRVDAADKVTGRAKYTDDLCPHPVLEAAVLHSTIANGWVKSMDISEAQALPGVVKVLTCFDVPDIQYPTPGHPWSVDPKHQDVSDRKLLNRRVRIYGDDIAAVVAEDLVTAHKALKLIRVEYEEYPVALEPEGAMADGFPPIHQEHPDNVLARMDLRTPIRGGEFETVEDVLSSPKFRQFQGHYETQQVQHCHIENPVSFAYMESGRITVVTSTQIPHIVRRVIGQALGIGWGSIRVVKPYIGGGFGNKQEVLYEPLNAWLTTQVGGRCVRLDVSREETFQNTRSRHPISFDVAAAVDKDGTLMARYCRAVSNQGGYASHGNAIVANAVTGYRQLYLDQIGHHAQALTVYTNRPAPGAMRGYGIPQCNFASECFMEDIAREMGLDPLEFRKKNAMPLGYVDPFNGITCHSTALRECIDKGAAYIGWEELREKYKNQTGPVRRGVGMACFSYKTGVYPISLETSSARMVLNQDGTVQLHLGATEIGQGGDTVFSQMAAQAIGIPTEDVHIISFQDTDTAPFDTLRRRALPRRRRPDHCRPAHRRRQRGEAHLPGRPGPQRLLLPGALGAHHRRGHQPLQGQHLLLRLLFRRGGGRHSRGQDQGAAHRQRPRLRQADQPPAGRGPGSRRHEHGAGLRPQRGDEVRPQDRPAAQRQPAGLQAAHRHGPPGAEGPVRGDG